jgi:predicted component of viral defense system (DUF524 family)
LNSLKCNKFIGDTHFETEDIENNVAVSKIHDELVRKIASDSKIGRAEVAIQTENRTLPRTEGTIPKNA